MTDDNQFNQNPHQPPAGSVPPAADQGFTPPPQQQYQAPGFQDPNFQQVPMQGHSAPQPGQGLAIASMVCGIISIPALCLWFLGIVLAIVAIALGGVHLNSVKNLPVQPGRGMAIAGIVCGIVTIALIILAVVVIVVLGTGEWNGDWDFE